MTTVVVDPRGDSQIMELENQYLQLLGTTMIVTDSIKTMSIVETAVLQNQFLFMTVLDGIPRDDFNYSTNYYQTRKVPNCFILEKLYLAYQFSIDGVYTIFHFYLNQFLFSIVNDVSTYYQIITHMIYL